MILSTTALASSDVLTGNRPIPISTKPLDLGVIPLPAFSYLKISSSSSNNPK